jgi:hypothetical protein
MCTPSYCFCDTCHGAIVPLRTKLNYQRKQLKTETITEQIQQRCEALPALSHSAGPFSLTSPAHLCPLSGISARPIDIPGSFGTSDRPGLLAQASTLVSALNDLTHVIYDTTLGIASSTSAINVNPEYVYEDPINFPDIDSPLDNIDLGDKGDHLITPGTLRLNSTMTEDNPDPFMVEHHNRQGTVNE